MEKKKKHAAVSEEVVKQFSVFRHTYSRSGFASYVAVATVVTPNFIFHHGCLMPEGFPQLVSQLMRATSPVL